MKKNNVVNAGVVTLGKANQFSNELINRLAGYVIDINKSKDKANKKEVDDYLKENVYAASGDALNTDLVRAYNKFIEAQEDYNRHVSFYVNTKFGADEIVTSLIDKVTETETFFTHEYLNKLGIYKIPCGTILDTTQKCVSFVSSLYATANRKHKEEIKDGKGIEIIVARIKERISFNDSVLIYTKFSKLETDKQLQLISDLIVDCTDCEKNNIFKRFNINFRIDASKVKSEVSDIIPIEGYIPKIRQININFYHEYAVNAIPLTDEDKAKVLSTPTTPLKGCSEIIAQTALNEATTKKTTKKTTK